MEYSNGESADHGKVSNAQEDQVRFVIDDDDYINAVKGRTAYAIDTLELFTSKKGSLGRVGKPYPPTTRSESNTSINEKFPDGTRLLYMTGHTTDNDGLQAVKFVYDSFN